MDVYNALKDWYPREKLVESLVPGFASGALVTAFDIFWSKCFFKMPPHFTECTIGHLLRQNQTMQWLWKGIHISLLAPAAEEILMRGVVYPLQKEISPQSSTFSHIGVNASIFALQHVDFLACLKRWQFHSIRFLPSTFFSGLVFCSLAEATNNLWAPTIAHMTINSLFFMHVSRRPKA